MFAKFIQRRRRWRGRGGHVPPQVLGYQLTLFGPRGQIMLAILLLGASSNMGADYARHITTGPPIFLDDAASLHYIYVHKIDKI